MTWWQWVLGVIEFSIAFWLTDRLARHKKVWPSLPQWLMPDDNDMELVMRAAEAHLHQQRMKFVNHVNAENTMARHVAALEFGTRRA
jgi:hypothetical protein